MDEIRPKIADDLREVLSDYVVDGARSLPGVDLGLTARAPR